MIKKYRIKKNEEFSSIIALKKSKASDSFVVYFAPRKEDYSRVGISVSKKLGVAVDRNKIKRQIRMMLVDFYDFESIYPYTQYCIFLNIFLIKVTGLLLNLLPNQIC